MARTQQLNLCNNPTSFNQERRLREACAAEVSILIRRAALASGMLLSLPREQSP